MLPIHLARIMLPSKNITETNFSNRLAGLARPIIKLDSHQAAKSAKQTVTF